jgi:flavin-binding protein dodecin
MSVVKVIELISKSGTSWEDAAQQAVAEAARTVRNIRDIYCADFRAKVDQNKIVEYKLTAKVSFLVDR